MKILHIIWSAHFGGIERLVIDLVQCQMARPDNAPAILVAGKMQGDFERLIKNLGCPVHTGMLNSGLDWSPVKACRISNVFRQYDILHFHTFNPLVALCASISNKRIIYTEHGNFGFGRKWTAADGIKEKLKKVFLNNHVAFITFNSQFTRNLAKDRYDLPSVPCDVVYNGINLEMEQDKPVVDPETRAAVEGKFVVGTTSRFAGFKRIDRLISAFADFQKDKDTLLLLVGDGKLKEKLVRQVESLGITEKTRFTGFQDNVRAYQALMDVSVFPSENEPFGLVAVETLSLGKPTIVFEDGGGIAEIVSGVEPENVVADMASLVFRMDWHYRNRRLARETAKLRKEYASSFDIKLIAERFQGVYEARMEPDQCAG